MNVALGTLDEMFLHLDEPTRPLTVHLEVAVDGVLDETRLRDAIQVAASKHPLARARLAPWPADAKAYEWIVDDAPQLDPLRVVDADESAGPALDELRGDLVSGPLPRGVTSIPCGACARVGR